MKNSFDRFKNKWNVEFSKEEIIKIDELKTKYANELYDRFTHDYEMFDFEISTHPTSASQIEELEKIKQNTESSRTFRKSYFDILKLQGATVIFNDKKFIEFAIGFSILDHDLEQVAYMVLLEIWQVHLLNLMILERQKMDMQLSTNYFKFNLDLDTNIFPNAESHHFFIQTINRKEFEITNKWISQLYRFLKSKTKQNPNCCIKSTEFEFADYWNKYNTGYIIKKYEKSTGIAPQNTLLTEYELIRNWYYEFIGVKTPS